MKHPIFIVGAPRSGTTTLGRIFQRHPDVAYWEEPRTIWEIGNAYGKSDDTLTEADVTPQIARKISDHFNQFLEKSGRTRFAEKTPLNILRLRFIHAIFPDCRIIFISRNGPASVASILKMRSRPPRPDRIWDRLRETPLLSIPALFFRALSRRRFLMRTPGWKSFPEDPIQSAVHQWIEADAIAERDLETLPVESILKIEYEAFVRDHRKFLTRIFDFCELEDSEAAHQYADETIDPNRAEPEIPDEVAETFSRLKVDSTNKPC